MFYGAVKQRFATFALAGILAVAFRQTNIVWFVAGIVLYAHEMPGVAGIRWGRRMAPLAVVGVCVALAWTLIIWSQGGIAMTPQTRSEHMVGLRGVPNVEFAIGLGGLLFFPVLASTGPLILRAMRSLRWALLFVGIILLVGYSFKARHMYNIEPSLVEGFLRNRVIYAVTHTPLRWAFSFVVAVAIFAFGYVAFLPRASSFKLPLYAIGTIALLPVELIEQRYYLPLFALFWIARAPVDPALERSQLVLGLSLSVAVLTAIARLQVFI